MSAQMPAMTYSGWKKSMLDSPSREKWSETTM
jgi:hypothetical protein